MGQPRFQLARGFKRTSKAGSATYASTTWATLDSSLDIPLAARVGDCLRCDVNMRKDDTGGAATFQLDAVTVVGGSPVTSLWSGAAAPTGTADAGVRGWLSTINGDHVAGSIVSPPLVAGDIASGLVTVRLIYRASASVTIGPGSSGQAIMFAVQNLGPVDPN